MGVTAVIGIGNLLLKDEGVGVHAVRALGERYFLPREVDLIDGGNMGLDLLPYLEGRDHLMLIDAVDFRSEPGAMRVIEGADMRAFLDVKFSIHQVGIPDMLFAAEFKGIRPGSMCLAGIQPFVIEAGIELSPGMEAHFDGYIEMIVRRLGDWGVAVTPKARAAVVK